MAEQDFERLLSTIEKLNGQMSTLVSRINAVKGQLTSLQEPAARESAGRSLGGLQTALNRLEARINQLSAQALRTASETRQGAERSAPYGRVPGEGFQIVGPAQVRQGLEAANVQGKIDSEVRRFARGVAERFQRSLIEGAISSRNIVSENQQQVINAANARQKEILEVAIRDRQILADRAARIRAINAEYDAKEARTGGYARPDFGSAGFTPRQAASGSPFETHIPTPGGEDPFVREYRRQAAQAEYANYLKSQLRDRFIDLVPERANKGAAGGVPDIADTLSAREVAEREALESARALIRSQKKYARALEIAAQQGYNPEDLKRLRTRGTGGIEQLQFQRTDEYGRQRNLDLFVNQAGRATPGISNQFRTFGQGVVRDIGELTKWSIALAAVYGPMRKVAELTQIMIENQTRLAEAVVSVASSFVDQADIFETAAQAAEFAGESISGVIDAFTQAYRAAGGGGNEVERFATASQLLNDSLILSKLSTLDQAQAIDTLSAALRQTGGDLSNGTELLDSWVRVTKVANIDLGSLATGFAVLGDAAEAAGIGTNELNGVLAAIAETGVASGRELANTARALVAGFQSDQAREALENIGVAFADTTGQARPFLDIMQELSNLRTTGVLDDTAFSKLTLALGGGTRRQAAYATFIENFSRVREVADESSRASGDAQQALAKQLETVQTSLTRLGNAFQELAQTLGTEGGFLGIITEGVNTMTALVRVFDDLVGILGKATPALAAFIAASALLRHQGHGGVGGYVRSLGQGLALTPQQIEENQLFGRLGAPIPFGQRASGFASRNLFGGNASSGIFQGLLASAIPAIMNFTSRDEDRFGGTKAAFNVGGGVLGGIVGTLGGPQGIAIGAIIGTSIAEAFVNATIARRTDIFAYQQGASLGGTVPGSTEGDLDQALRDAEIKLYESIGFGNESLGRFISAPSRTDDIMLERVNEAIRAGDRDRLNRATGGVNQRELERLGITPDILRQAFAEGKEIEISDENKAYRLASEEARAEYDRALAARTALGGTPLDSSTAFSQLVEENKAAFGDLLKGIRESSREDLRERRVSGEVRGAEYGRRTEALSGFDTKALQYYTALGDQVDLITGGADDATRAFEVLNNVIVGGSEEALPQLTSISGEIQTILNQLDTPVGRETLVAKFGDLNAAKEQLADLQAALGQTISDINDQVLLGRLDIPDVQGDINKPLSTGDYAQVEQRARQLQDDFYQGFLEIPDDMYDALKGSFDEWAQIVEDSGDVFYQRVTEIDPQFFQQAFQELLEQQKLTSQKESPFGIQQVDLDSSRAAELQSMTSYFTRYLSTNFPQYEQNPEDIGIIFNDYVTSVLHGDNLAVKLALEKLVDINQKQLDGMYNIPEGATFWVPLTAAYYRPKNEGAGGLPALGDVENNGALDRNTQALATLTSVLQGTALDNGQANPFAGKYAASLEQQLNQRDAVRFRGDPGYSRNPRIGTLPHEDRYDRMNVGGISGEDREVSTFLQKLQEWFRNLFTTIGDRSKYGVGNAGNAGNDGGRGRSLSNAGVAQVNPQINARLDMRIDNQTQLIVDGRILASIISPYLSQELIRLEASQGTVTKRYVI